MCCSFWGSPLTKIIWLFFHYPKALEEKNVYISYIYNIYSFWFRLVFPSKTTSVPSIHVFHLTCFLFGQELGDLKHGNMTVGMAVTFSSQTCCCWNSSPRTCKVEHFRRLSWEVLGSLFLGSLRWLRCRQ